MEKELPRTSGIPLFSIMWKTNMQITFGTVFIYLFLPIDISNILSIYCHTILTFAGESILLIDQTFHVSHTESKIKPDFWYF